MTTESTDKPDLKTRVQEIIDSMINPAVAGHGGFVELIDVQDNRVYLVMGGGCLAAFSQLRRFPRRGGMRQGIA